MRMDFFKANGMPDTMAVQLRGDVPADLMRTDIPMTEFTADAP